MHVIRGAALAMIELIADMHPDGRQVFEDRVFPVDGGDLVFMALAMAAAGPFTFPNPDLLQILVQIDTVSVAGCPPQQAGHRLIFQPTGE